MDNIDSWFDFRIDLEYLHIQWLAINSNGQVFVRTGSFPISNPNKRIIYFVSDPSSVNHKAVNTFTEFQLLQNYLNLFNPYSIIKYLLAVFNNVLSNIYDVLDKEVIALANKQQGYSKYEVTLDGCRL